MAGIRVIEVMGRRALWRRVQLFGSARRKPAPPDTAFATALAVYCANFIFI
jgi:hypothetical protein